MGTIQFLKQIEVMTGGENGFIHELLKKGKSFSEIGNIKKEHLKDDVQLKGCYRNSIIKAIRFKSFKYVEGYVLTLGGIPIQHAWCVNEGGVIYDFTAQKFNHKHEDYFGVEIEHDELLSIIESCNDDDWRTPLEYLFYKKARGLN